MKKVRSTPEPSSLVIKARLEVLPHLPDPRPLGGKDVVSGKEGCSEVRRGKERALTTPTPLRRPLTPSLCFPISLPPPRLYLSLP